MSDKEFATSTIDIEVASTWIRLKATRQGAIGNVNIGTFVKENLQEKDWQPRFHSYVVTARYTYYDAVTGYAYLPRYTLNKLTSYLKNSLNTTVNIINIDPVKPKNIKMVTKKAFQPRDNQIAIIDFLLDDTNTFKPLSAQTGIGKTYCSIYAACKLGHPTLIVLGLLIDQWYDSILKFTDIPADDIYVIKGFDTLECLWEGIKNGFRPKILLCSTRTLAMYCVNPSMSYLGLPSYAELQSKLKIGVKIIDECHLNFNTNTMIDFQTNVKYNIYLSATYQRSNQQGKRIFDMYFPSYLKFGDQFTKKYTAVIMEYYHLHIPAKDTARFRLHKGYMHALYENYLVEHVEYMSLFITEVIRPIIIKRFINVKKEGQHLLILVATKQFAKEFKAYLDESNLNLELAIFFSGDAGELGNEENLQKEVIISTIKSCGTGRDIKGLKTCVNTVSFSSEPLTAQVMGRLRQIPGEDTYFIDLCNLDISQHRMHANNRICTYDLKALSFSEETLR
jgi:superfamily II DNA or RNA helicase